MMYVPGRVDGTDPFEVMMTALLRRRSKVMRNGDPSRGWCEGSSAAGDHRVDAAGRGVVALKTANLLGQARGDMLAGANAVVQVGPDRLLGPADVVLRAPVGELHL